MASFDHWDLRLTREELRQLLIRLCEGHYRTWLSDDELGIESETGTKWAHGQITPAPGGMRIDVTFGESRRPLGFLELVNDLLVGSPPEGPPPALVASVRRAFGAVEPLRMSQAEMVKALAQPRPESGRIEHFGSGVAMAAAEVPGCEGLSLQPDLEANDELWARAWISAPLRAEWQALSEHVNFGLARGVLLATQRAPVVMDDQRQRTTALVASIASRGLELVKQWRAAATALHAQLRADSEVWSDAGTRIEMNQSGSPVIVDGCRPESRFHTRIRVLRALSVEETVLPAVGSLPARALTGREGVTLLLEGFESDPERLRAACDLAVELALRYGPAISMGPYR